MPDDPNHSEVNQNTVQTSRNISSNSLSLYPFGEFEEDFHSIAASDTKTNNIEDETRISSNSNDSTRMHNSHSESRYNDEVNKHTSGENICDLENDIQFQELDSNLDYSLGEDVTITTNIDNIVS